MAKRKEKELHEYAPPGAEWRTKGKRQVRATQKSKGERAKEQFDRIHAKLERNYYLGFVKQAEQADTSEKRIVLRTEIQKKNPEYQGKSLEYITLDLKKRYQI